MVTEKKNAPSVSCKKKVNVTDPGSQPHKPASTVTVCISQFSCFVIVTNSSELYGDKEEWSVLAQSSDRWLVLMNLIMNLRVP
jgi:hypothetical protein